MPYQVSWQSVSMKSQRPVHVLGAEAAVVGEVLAGEAFLAAPSAAPASTPLAAPAAARIVSTKMPSFVMAAPLPQHGPSSFGKSQLQGTVDAVCCVGRKF